MSLVEEDAAMEQANARLGKVHEGVWRFESLVGGGSAACVYVVVHEANGTRAAAKVLHPHWADVPEVRARFVREGKAANAVTHRGIVRVFDEGVLDDGAPFLVMELLHGESLEERWIRKGRRLTVKEVLWAADQVLAVLGAAHAKGIVHRDVKPENVFVTHERVIKLLDFGIARVTDAAGERTRAGTLLGTPAFLSPEQARGDGVIGAKTDLWAVGATMFTLLSGRYVHEEEELVHQLVAASTKPAPSLVTVAPHVPRSIVHIVDFALQFHAKDRWPNAAAFRQAIRVAYTEWAKAPMPEEGDDALDDDGPRVVNAPSAPPPSISQASLASQAAPPGSAGAGAKPRG